jgi:hypothetical protein
MREKERHWYNETVVKFKNLSCECGEYLVVDVARWKERESGSAKCQL